MATLVTLCAAPVIVALISTVFLGERPTRRLLFSAVLAMAGWGGMGFRTAKLGVLFAQKQTDST